MMTIEKLASEFLVYLEKNKRRSRRTVRNYGLYLRRFSDWLLKRGIENPRDLTKKVIDEYSAWLKNFYALLRRTYLKDNSRRCHLIAVRMFLRFLIRTGRLVFDYQSVKLPRLSRAGSNLRRDDLEKVLNASLAAKQSRFLAMRDAAILELLHGTGLKVSEISGLRKDDLNLRRNLIQVRGKYGRREAAITNQARHWLEQYLAARKDKAEFVFIGHDRTFFERRRRDIKGLTPRSIERIVKKHSGIAQLDEKITPESFRKNFVAGLMKKGESAENIKKRLGFVSDSFKNKFITRTDS